MKQLYRIYYSVFDSSKHELVLKTLSERYNARVVDHPSRVHPDFHFVELYLDRPGLEEEIQDLVRTLLGVLHVKVDWIDTTR